MTSPATFRRAAAAVGLLAAGVLMLVSVLLAPEFPGDAEALLVEIDRAGTAGTVSALTFTLAQLPLVAGLLGLGHLLRSRAPRLSNLGTSLALVGAFGHAVYGGVALVQLEMAADAVHHDVHAAVLDGLEAGPAVAFMAMGLLGTVLGLLLLSIGMWRARVTPRWAAPALWLFLVLEFAGSAVSTWAGHAAGLLYLLVLAAWATTLWRSPLGQWRTADEGVSHADPVPLSQRR